MVIVVTGGVASGKTAVTEILSGYGFEIIDADVISRELTAKGGAGAERIMAEFGQEYFSDGTLNRKALSGLVFSDKTALKKLESILHPLIYDAIKKKLSAIKDGDAAVCIPLYFESGVKIDCKEVWTINCDEKTRINRLVLRDNISTEHARKILAAQMTDEERAKRADVIINNNGTIEELGIKVREAVKKAILKDFTEKKENNSKTK